jgi:hypothetical protein
MVVNVLPTPTSKPGHLRDYRCASRRRSGAADSAIAGFGLSFSGSPEPLSRGRGSPGEARW